MFLKTLQRCLLISPEYCPDPTIEQAHLQQAQVARQILTNFLLFAYTNNSNVLVYHRGQKNNSTPSLIFHFYKTVTFS